jgi:hypothetical protein
MTHSVSDPSPSRRREVCYRNHMRQILIATVALLVLSGCKTSGYNPLKIETRERWDLADGFKQLLTSLMGRSH